MAGASGDLRNGAVVQDKSGFFRGEFLLHHHLFRVKPVFGAYTLAYHASEQAVVVRRFDKSGEIARVFIVKRNTDFRVQ